VKKHKGQHDKDRDNNNGKKLTVDKGNKFDKK